jgi:hypothetical protein
MVPVTTETTFSTTITINNSIYLPGFSDLASILGDSDDYSDDYFGPPQTIQIDSNLVNLPDTQITLNNTFSSSSYYFLPGNSSVSSSSSSSGGSSGSCGTLGNAPCNGPTIITPQQRAASQKAAICQTLYQAKMGGYGAAAGLGLWAAGNALVGDEPGAVLLGFGAALSGAGGYVADLSHDLYCGHN